MTQFNERLRTYVLFVYVSPFAWSVTRSMTRGARANLGQAKFPRLSGLPCFISMKCPRWKDWKKGKSWKGEKKIRKNKSTASLGKATHRWIPEASFRTGIVPWTRSRAHFYFNEKKVGERGDPPPLWLFLLCVSRRRLWLFSFYPIRRAFSSPARSAGIN